MRQEVTYDLVGTTLEQPIVVKGRVLVNEGVVLTESLVAKLLKLGIKYIDVIQKEEVNTTEVHIEIPNTVSDELCEKVRESLMNNNVKEIESVASDMITSVLRISNLDGGFSNLKYDLETFRNINSLDHSIRVAIFSIILTYLYNQNLRGRIVGSGAVSGEVNINDVAVAALMHDEGSNFYEDDTFNKINALAQNSEFATKFPGIINVPLDRRDDAFIPIYSFCLVHDLKDLSTEAKFMILMSGETENNMGPLNPVGFSEDKSNMVIGAKIIRLCSFYDNFLAHCYNTGVSFENVISVLGESAVTGAINQELADLFMTKVPIYPIGAKVLLTNGERAEVIKSYADYTYSTRPQVRVLKTGEIIDLRYATTLTVDSVCRQENSLEQVIDRQVDTVDIGRK